jgi:hypothetical protein
MRRAVAAAELAPAPFSDFFNGFLRAIVVSTVPLLFKPHLKFALQQSTIEFDPIHLTC